MLQAISYTLPNPAYEDYTWILQDEHQAGAAPPLYWSGGMFALPDPPAGDVPYRLMLHGFTYARPEVSGQNPFGAARPPASVADLTAWREVWPPQIEDLARRLEGFDAAAVPAGEWASILAAQEREMGRVFAGVHLATVISGYMAVAAFTEAYVRRFGEEARPETLTLLQGFPNLSLDRACALWDLSRIARRAPEVAEALAKGSAMPATAAGREFSELLDETLRRFGHTTNIGGAHLPTWAEDTGIPLEIVRGYTRIDEGRGPREGARRQAEERAALERKVAAAADASLSSLLAMAQQYLPNLEDHNMVCDQRLGAAHRARWLAIGRHLLPRGLGNADNVFYYERAELIEALEGGDLLPPETIAERGALMEAIATHPPPPVLGKRREHTDGARLEPATRRTIRGVAASRGVYTGRARIIERLEDARRLEQGDVMVARMTSPPWTPLFATIGALVVNTGGALSHGSVVAREFGIPAVVGTTYGTTMIPDGATVTVDGTAGIVTVEG